MPAPNIAAEQRYIRPGVTDVIIAPSVASTSGAATRAEINAGINVSAAIRSAAGFTQSASKIDTPDWGSRIVTNIPGVINIPDSSLVFYADLHGADIRDELAMDDECVVIFMDAGDVPADPMDVYKCAVASVSSSKDNDPTTVTVSFTVREVFERVTIPA